MSLGRKRLQAYVQEMVHREPVDVGPQGVADLLERGRQWKLAATLKKGGTILFPHAVLADCGHHLAAAVHACLD